MNFVMLEGKADLFPSWTFYDVGERGVFVTVVAEVEKDGDKEKHYLCRGTELFSRIVYPKLEIK